MKNKQQKNSLILVILATIAVFVHVPYMALSYDGNDLENTSIGHWDEMGSSYESGDMNNEESGMMLCCFEKKFDLVKAINSPSYKAGTKLAPSQIGDTFENYKEVYLDFSFEDSYGMHPPDEDFLIGSIVKIE